MTTVVEEKKESKKRFRDVDEESAPSVVTQEWHKAFRIDMDQVKEYQKTIVEQAVAAIEARLLAGHVDGHRKDTTSLSVSELSQKTIPFILMISQVVKIGNVARSVLYPWIGEYQWLYDTERQCIYKIIVTTESKSRLAKLMEETKEEKKQKNVKEVSLSTMMATALKNMVHNDRGLWRVYDPLAWKSRLHPYSASHEIEAEWIALSGACRFGNWKKDKTTEMFHLLMNYVKQFMYPSHNYFKLDMTSWTKLRKQKCYRYYDFNTALSTPVPSVTTLSVTSSSIIA